jgi:hypothetical protein
MRISLGLGSTTFASWDGNGLFTSTRFVKVSFESAEVFYKRQKIPAVIDLNWLWLKLIEVVFQLRAITTTSWLKSIRSISITINHIPITFNQASIPFFLKKSVYLCRALKRYNVLSGRCHYSLVFFYWKLVTVVKHFNNIQSHSIRHPFLL